MQYAIAASLTNRNLGSLQGLKVCGSWSSTCEMKHHEPLRSGARISPILIDKPPFPYLGLQQHGGNI